MALTVHKYPLELTDLQQVEMPAMATILTVQVQNGQPVLWALVTPANLPNRRTIRLVGTGHPIDMAGRYIATIQLVLHAFER